ncbi:hypothetical protein [Klebsiella pneumoniae ISC21]|nr:hypothetical protein [Klebsiella pneumoniae ISC21]
MNWQRFNKVSSFSGETSGIVKKKFYYYRGVAEQSLSGGNSESFIYRG